jgi:hypothetical protein
MAARLMVMSCGGGEGGRPTCQLPAILGLVEEPVAMHAAGNAVADMRRFQPDWGKHNVRLIGGREETGASWAFIATRRAAPPAYPTRLLVLR